MYESAYIVGCPGCRISQKAQKIFTMFCILCADVKKLLSKCKVFPFTENQGLFTICS